MKRRTTPAGTRLLVGVLGLAALSACLSTSSRAGPAAAGPHPGATLASGEAASPSVETFVDEDRKEVVVLAGPFKISAAGHGEGAGAGTGDHHHTHGHDATPPPAAGHAHEDRSPLIPLEWPVDGGLRGFSVTLFDRDGNVLSRDLLHHLIAVNFDRRQVVYPVPERIFGVGQETEDITLPRGFGVPLEAGTRIGIYASWHGQGAQDLDEVYLEVRMPYRPPGARGPGRNVLPIYMDVNNVIGETNAYDLPPGRSVRVYEFEMPVSGRLLAASGHLHDYGVAVRLEDAETGEVLVTVEGIRDEEGRLLGMEQKVLRRFRGLLDASVPLQAGRRYRVVGIYDSPLDHVRPAGAMAHMVGVFEPAEWGGWTAVDRESPLYLEDLSGLPEPLRSFDVLREWEGREGK